LQNKLKKVFKKLIIYFLSNLSDKAKIEKLKAELEKLIQIQEEKEKEFLQRQSKDVQTVFSSTEWQALQQRVDVFFYKILFILL
jgi:predicted ATP-binding protein involved in virulence